MKDINIYINESTTKFSDIQNYGKSWTIEHQPEEFINMLNAFLDGTLQGLNDNKYAYKQKDYIIDIIYDNIKLINNIKKDINND